MKAPQRMITERVKVLNLFLVIAFCLAISGMRAESPPSTSTSEDRQNGGSTTPGMFREKLEEGARDKLEEGAQRWEYALQNLSAHRPSGWLLCVVLGILGLGLLGFGQRLIKKGFVPIVTLIGVGAGGYLGLQLSILAFGYPSDITQVIAMSCGTVAVGVLFLFSAAKARPIAWMFLVATPFIMVSALIAAVNPLAAILSALGGSVLAILTSLRHRVLATVSTSMLGAFSLTFSAGLLMHLVRSPKLQALFVSVVDYPFVLALVIIVMIIAGADFQLLFSGGDE